MTTIIDYIGKVKEIFALDMKVYESAINDIIAAENPKIAKHYLTEALKEWEYYFEYGRFKDSLQASKFEKIPLTGIIISFNLFQKKPKRDQLEYINLLIEKVDIKKIPTPRTTAAINQNDIPTEYSNPPPNKIDILRSHLKEYGFYELDKVKILKEGHREQLIEDLTNSGIPLAIAMFDYLGFIEYLEKNYFDRKEDLYNTFSNWLNKSYRAITGNIKSLDTKSEQHESERYSAWNYKDNVKEYYKNLIKRSMT